MKPLKAKDLREKSIEELEQMLAQQHADLYQNRRDLVFRRVTDISSIKVRRHDIARIKTVITEKQSEVKA
jgi:large subunit ribosomal protein L29